MKKPLSIFLFTLLWTFSAFAYRVMPETDAEEKNISINGSGYIMFGQVGSGHSFGKQGSNEIHHHWQNFYSGRIDAISQPIDWFRTLISLEIGSAWPIVRESTIMKETFKLQFRPVLPQAVGIFNFGIDELVDFEIEAGMMEYAFNTEVKNLGNYLYRSSAYPLTMVTNIDNIYSSLMGARVQAGFFENQLKFGALMNSITHQSPFFDFNLSLYLSYLMPNRLLDVGLGFMFERLIAIDKDATDCTTLWSALGDSTLTLRGQKLDARVTLDIKQIFPDVTIFGENDLKIYAEGAILGLKDPAYYPDDPNYPGSNLLHRIPLMFGINVPTFKILDLLTFEMEYCSYPYPIDWWGMSQAAPSPKPANITGTSPDDVKWREIYKTKDNLKWTFYLKKSISKFDIIGLIANDHIRYETFFPERQFFTEQSLRDNKDWHWYIKLQYNL